MNFLTAVYFKTLSLFTVLAPARPGGINFWTR